MPDNEIKAVQRVFTVNDGFCVIHMTTRNEGDARCLWDRVTGNRPGRANCIFTDAVITYIKKEIPF